MLVEETLDFQIILQKNIGKKYHGGKLFYLSLQPFSDCTLSSQSKIIPRMNTSRQRSVRFLEVVRNLFVKSTQ